MTFPYCPTLIAGSEEACHYVEPIARARSANFGGKVWADMLSGLRRLAKAGDEAWITPIHGPYLLGRARFASGNVRYASRTHNRYGLQDARVPSPPQAVHRIRLS